MFCGVTSNIKPHYTAMTSAETTGAGRCSRWVRTDLSDDVAGRDLGAAETTGGSRQLVGAVAMVPPVASSRCIAASGLLR